MCELNNILITICIGFLYNNVYDSTTVLCKPTFSLPLFEHLTHFAGFNKRDTNKFDDISSRVKPYSGVRIKNDSLRMIYYYDQTIAVTEIGPERLLLNCELIEVVDPKDANATLYQYRDTISRPLVITLNEMLKLMKQCEMIEKPTTGDINFDTDLDTIIATKTTPQQSPATNPLQALLHLNRNNNYDATTRSPSGAFSVFNGIAPGTKWCGSGDIAVNYHDLGADANVDKCCRTHDICPVKIAKYTMRYALYNDSPFTRSYCKCDDMLYSCLKESNSSSGQLFGNIFFNLVQTTCIDQTEDGKWIFRKNKMQF